LNFIHYFAAQSACWGAFPPGRGRQNRVLKMSRPEHGAIFDTASAVMSAVSAVPRAAVRPGAPTRLSPAALAAAKEPYEPAYSPIVLAGLVRVIEVALVALVGFAVYAIYVVPAHGFA
jgi:hypothetical protein